MTTYSNRTFESVFDDGTGAVVSGMSFVQCDFVHCGLSVTHEIGRRTIVRNVELRDCRLNGCDVGPAILEDVSIQSLQTNDLLLLWGTLFRHVTLSGQIGKIKLNPFACAVDRTPETQGPFDAFRNRFYSGADWALDIRHARFKECELRGIPARLIQRDPESQFVVTRELALNPSWRERVSPSNELWPFAIDMLLSDGETDRVFIAPLGAPKARRDRLLKELNELRTAGVALPD